MSLYIKPPSGTISLKTLECFVINRLNFLMKIVEAKTTDSTILQSIVNDSVYQSQCLISGTQKDCISHFTLRLILSQDDETSTFLLEAEKVLFKFRCWCLTEDELYRFLKTFNKFTNYVIPSFQNSNLSVALKSLLELKKQCENSWRILAFRYFNHDGSFQVPFQTVLPLVHKRLIILKNGIAFVPYSQLPVFLTELFSLFLDTGLKQARNQDNSDDRLNYISQIILKRCRLYLKRKTGSRNELYLPGLHLDKHCINKHSRIFPPCMLNLHQTLRHRHRLNHHARIQYTLFLKEFGMSVDDAIDFWSEEYSRPARPDTDWGTDWKRAASRYIYNIRHLYGLEGSRRNYTGHCCKSIQNQIMKPTDAGGCPFVHFDPEHFNNFLQNQSLSDNDIKHLVNLRNRGKYNEACGFYRDCVLSKSFGEETNVNQKISSQQDGGGVSVNCDRTTYIGLDRLHIFKNHSERRYLNIDDENNRTVLEKHKLDHKEIFSINNDSERQYVNITGHSEMKTMSEIISNNKSRERKFVNIDEKNEKSSLVRSVKRYLDIEGKIKSPKRKLIDKEMTVVTKTKKICVSRNHYNIVHPETKENPGLANGQLFDDRLDTSDDDQDYFGCEHRDCPSQRDPRRDCPSQRDPRSNCPKLFPTSVIKKPLDYCLSYQTLLYKLHKLS